MRNEEQEKSARAHTDVSMQHWSRTTEAIEHASKYSNRFLESLITGALQAALKSEASIDEAIVASARAMVTEAGEKAASELLGDDTSSSAVDYLLSPRILEDLATLRTKPTHGLVQSLLVELEERGVDLNLPQGKMGTPGVGSVEGLLQPPEGHVVSHSDMTMEGRVEARPPTLWATTSTAHLLVLLTLIVWFLVNWNSARETVCDLNRRIPPSTSFSEVRKLIRTHLCGVPSAYVRIVSGNKVNLRVEPRMKANVITTLTKGKLVTVVSYDNPKWLNVSVEVEGHEIEGWVSRKYLKKIR